MLVSGMISVGPPGSAAVSAVFLDTGEHLQCQTLGSCYRVFPVYDLDFISRSHQCYPVQDFLFLSLVQTFLTLVVTPLILSFPEFCTVVKYMD